MEPIAVSIIVPIYRTEAFLEQCIKSLLAQSLTNIEIILVDDGSPDGCGKICDAYALVDDRIKVCHQKNAGVGAARNHGLELASGEYIGFVDSDDWVSANMYEKLYQAGKANHCDVVSCNFAYYRDNGRESKFIEEKQTIPHEKVIDKSDFLEYIYLPTIKGRIFTALWNKIYAKSLLKENNIVFPSNIPLREDYYFHMDIFTYAESMIHVGEIGYFYRWNHDGTSRQRFANYFDLSMGLYESIREHMNRWGIGSEPYLKLAYIRCLVLGIESIGKTWSYNQDSTRRKLEKVADILNDRHIIQAAKLISSRDLADETGSIRFLLAPIKSKNIPLLLIGLFYAKIYRMLETIWVSGDG